MDSCLLCNLTVAPYARYNNEPDREVIGRFVVHRRCLVQYQVTARQIQEASSRKRFRLKDLFRRHPRG